MANIKIADIKGVNSDIDPVELPPNYLTYGINYRVFNSKVFASGGHSCWSVANAAIYPGLLHFVSGGGNDSWVVLGRNSVYAFDGREANCNPIDYPAGLGWVDITGTAINLASGAELLWTSSDLGAHPIYNNPDFYPQTWDGNPASNLQDMVWGTRSVTNGIYSTADDTWNTQGMRCKAMRVHKDKIIALGMIENGVEYPDVLRWSHPAGGNTLPFTWDETDPTTLAGRFALGSNGGGIVDGLSLQDNFVVYSESAIDVLDDTGDTSVFRRRRMTSIYGLLTVNGIVEVKGRHYFISDGDFVVNDGREVKSITHDRIRTRMNRNLSKESYRNAYAVAHSALKEVWFCMPEDGSEFPNIAYIYNWSDDTWSIRELNDRIAGEEEFPDERGVRHIAYGARQELAEGADTWNANHPNDTWDDGANIAWGTDKRTPLNDTMIGIWQDTATSQPGLLDMDPTVSDNPFKTVMERTDLRFTDSAQVMTINYVYFDANGKGEVRFDIADQLHNGLVSWRRPSFFVPAYTRKVPVRATGNLFSYRLTSTGTSNWWITSLELEGIANGRR